MATHSSVLAWRIPGMGEPGGLPSMGLHRVRHDWSDLAAAVASATCETISSHKYMCNWSSKSRDGKKEAEKKYLKEKKWLNICHNWF